MRAGRHNIPIPEGREPDQCPADITLRDDQGNDLWTVPCNRPVHPAASGHRFTMEWLDVYSDHPLVPDPPKLQVVRSQDGGTVFAYVPRGKR